MLIHSAVFGEMNISDQSVYRVPGGLFGFDEIEKYALVTKQDGDVTLLWFQSVESKVPCFVVFNPFDIITGYIPELEASDLRALGAGKDDKLIYLVIAVVPEDISKITVNLKSPIVLNPKTQLARQVILRNEYPFRFSLVESESDEEPELVEVVR